MEYIEQKTEKKIEKKSDKFEQIIQKDIANLETRIEKRLGDINKSIYIVGLVQFLAIVSSVLAIINYIAK